MSSLVYSSILRWVPLPGYVLVQPSAQAETTASGLILPKTAAADHVEALVVAVGDFRQLSSGAMRQRAVALDDRVLIDADAGQPITVDGVMYRLLPEDDVLLVYVREPNLCR